MRQPNKTQAQTVAKTEKTNGFEWPNTTTTITLIGGGVALGALLMALRNNRPPQQ